MSEVSRWMPGLACSTASLADRGDSRFRLLTVGRSHLVLVTAGHPLALPPINHTAPVPRRIRAVLDGHVVVDTTSALYLWEWSHYPQYYIPVDDIDPAMLVDEQHQQKLSRGTARRYALQVGDVVRPAALRIYGNDTTVEGLAGRARFEWDSLDAWFEEDEQVFVHPRDPYTRADALRSTRNIRIELDGVMLADPARLCWCSRPGCRLATTSTPPKSTSPTSPRPTRQRLPIKGHHQRLLDRAGR